MTLVTDLITDYTDHKAQAAFAANIAISLREEYDPNAISLIWVELATLHNTVAVLQAQVVALQAAQQVQQAQATGISQEAAQTAVSQEFAQVPILQADLQQQAAVLRARIEDCDLPIRAWNVLSNYDIHTVAQLTECTEKWLLGRKNMGRVTVYEIRKFLSTYGLALKTTP